MSDSKEKAALRRHYATDAQIKTRQAIHDQYTFPPHDYKDWVLSNYQWRGGERVLDVGCGNGLYYHPLIHRLTNGRAPIKYVGLDLSAGILAAHPGAESGRVLNGDALELPFAAGSFDVVMANHMLFHVDNLDRAIVEFRRVLKPGGVLLAATNSLFNMYTLRKLLHRSATLLSKQGSDVEPMHMPSDSFTLELGVMLLSRYFYAVMRSDLPSALIFDDIEPFMTYLESTRDLRERELPDDVRWDELMAFIRQQVLNRIVYDGNLVIDKLSGVLVATDRGDFAHRFVEAREALAEPVEPD
jgi:SAM-dependent methyltransferase